MASVMHSNEMREDGDDSIKEVQPESSRKQEKQQPKKRKVIESNEMQKDSDDSMKEVQPESSSKREPEKRKPKSEIWEDIDPETGCNSAFWDNFFFLKRGPVNVIERQKAMAYNIKYGWNHEKNCDSYMKIKVPKNKRMKIFSLESLQKKLKKEKKEREEKVAKIFQLLPSINGIKATDGYKIKIRKTLDQLINDAVAIKKHLETHLNVKGSEFLLKAVEYVIDLVALFSSEIVLPTFDWNTLQYPEECPEISYDVDVEEKCELVKDRFLTNRGLVLPFMDKIWCQPVGSSFDGMEKNIWLEFKEFDMGNPEEVRRSIQLDHPIVSVIGEFAVAVFNEACKMNVKKDLHNNLHHFEFIECQYVKLYHTYYFHMIIEAIEEGNLGVYETEVMCSSDGSLRRLVKFLLTDRKPVGLRATAVSLFSSLRSVCKTVEGVAEEKLSKLKKVVDVLKVGEQRGKAMHKLSCVGSLRTKIIEDLHQLFFRERLLLFDKDCSRTTCPDAWSNLDNNFDSAMVRRTEGTPCRGYDYLISCSHG